jgi:hypothetical protein
VPKPDNFPPEPNRRVGSRNFDAAARFEGAQTGGR